MQNPIYIMVDKTPLRALVLLIFDAQFFSRAMYQKSRCFTETALDRRAPSARLS